MDERARLSDGGGVVGGGASPRGEARRGSPRAALLEALASPRYEVLPLAGIEDAVAEHVATDVKLTVTVSPTRGIATTLDVAARLSELGYRVVPHVAARLVVDEAHLEEILQQLHALHLREVFVVAGDTEQPSGRFEGAAHLLAAMAELGHGLDAIGITGYPESHPFISDAATIDAMFAKERFATYIVSQITFDPGTIRSWIDRVRRRGTQLPIYIGVAGPVARKRLLRISTRIGVGDSLRFLSRHGGWLPRVFLPGSYSPEGLLEQLAPELADPAKRVPGFHVYTFNAVDQTERWRREAIDRLREGPD